MSFVPLSKIIVTSLSSYGVNMSDDIYSESSGICLSQSEDYSRPDDIDVREKFEYSNEKHGLVESYHKNDFSLYQSQNQQFSTPYFLRTGRDLSSNVKVKNNVETKYRHSFFPRLETESKIYAPRTVGKYTRRVMIAPTLNLRTPPQPTSQLPPQPLPYLLKDQFLKERKYPRPSSTEMDLAKVLDNSLLTSDEALEENLNSLPSSTFDEKSKISLPDIPFIHKNTSFKSNKDPRYVWVPRLSAWVPDDQNRGTNYFHFGHPSIITEKYLSICSNFHDFYHHALNCKIGNARPEHCERFFHHHKRRINNAARKTLPKLAPLKRKPPTIPKDPFSLKSERDSKRPWLKDPALAKGKTLNEVDKVDNSHDDESFSSVWMINKSTMTGDSSFDAFSFIMSQSEINHENTHQEYLVRKKKRKVKMVDRACEVEIQSEESSPLFSHQSAESAYLEVEDDFEDNSIPQNILPEPQSSTPHIVEDVEQVTGNSTESNLETAANNVDENQEIETTEFDNEKTNTSPEDEVKNENNTEQNDGKDLHQVNNEVFQEHDISDEIEKLNVNKNNAENNYSNTSEKNSSKNIQSTTKRKEKRKLLPPAPPPPRFLEEQRSENFNNSSNIKQIRKNKTKVVIPQPTLTDEDRPFSSKTAASRSSSKKSSKRREVARAFLEEKKRNQLEEKRRKNMNEQHKKNQQDENPIIDSPVRFSTPEEVDDFLQKYSILKPDKMEFYRQVFDSFDIDEDGFLDADEVFYALRKIVSNRSFKESHVNHIYRLLELVDYKQKHSKIDFKLFAVMTSLAQRISTLDDFMIGLIDKFDLQSLDAKMWRAREFFKYFADDQNKQFISMKSLWIELKTGGIGPKLESQIRKTMKDLPHLDLLDFLTYLPLFTLTHSHAVSHPMNIEKIITS